ncbi:MAG: GGDEF domain-containing protein [Gallionella sp.]|jgi:diguanylate cyclase (GGDEF)-like protein|nr:GGDEF domain-containing protein [Gallionella sp.]MCK9355217.1 GGDEF domain-containing protein [Gallionella sp.]
MNSVVKELAQTELFRDTPESILQMVMEHATPLELSAGEVLLAPNRDNQHVYLLLSGVLGVHFDSLDSPEIRQLTKGISVGEMSIIDGTAPSAYVVAKEACRVFPIHRELMHQLVADTNPVARNLLRLLTQWMKANTQRIVKDRLQIWELTDHANVDALSGLYNRRWLDNAFSRLLEQASKGAQPLCILLIDVDHFKKYNDTFGHLGGDQALIALGEVLKTSVRPYDFATRYGGEEFLVILPNTNREQCLVVAERIRQSIEKKSITSANGEPMPGITISVGLSMNNAQSTPQSLIADADEQLYRAKAAGRNCVRYCDQGDR